ncbi:MAG: acyl-CoA desaturase [Pseudomonadota bacterium]
MHADYANPRIDGHDKDADAVAGAVYADPAKVVWVGAMAVLGIVGAALTMTTGAVVLFVVSTAVTLCLGHSLGMHRRFIHKSYRCPKWLEYLFVHFGVLVGLAGPFGMLRTHDLRDWAQRQTACHPYFSHASRWHKDLLWQLFFSIRLERPPRIDIDADYASDPVYRVMERTWHFQQLPWAILFYAIGGWGWVAWGIGSRVTVSIFGHWLIGYFAHNEGERRWHVEGAAVQGHNVRWTALLTMGECWHNNHHAFPGSARLGLEPEQWDPGWWVLQGMEHVGLARDFVLPEQLRPRAELVDLAKTLR